MKARLRLWFGVAVALYPVSCETTLRAPAAGGSAGTLGAGASAGDAAMNAGAPALGGSAGTSGAAGDDDELPPAGSAGRGAGGSSSQAQGGANDEPLRGGKGGSTSGRAGSGNATSGGSGGTTAEVGGSSATTGGTSNAGGEGGEGDIFAAPPRCTSGLFRDPNESEGPEMNPGFACNQCHVRDNAESGEGDAPVFAFAGTAFPSAHEPSSCIAADAAGAEIIVTDAGGTEFSAVANAVGNFFLEEGALVLPITARVVVNGRVRKMDKPVPFADCNLCHTQDGTRVLTDGEVPPGRIVLP